MAAGTLSTIKIHRMIPIVNGYLQIPPNKEANKQTVGISSVASITGSKLTILGSGAGGANTAGGNYGNQMIVELPGVAVDAVDTVYNQYKALV